MNFKFYLQLKKNYIVLLTTSVVTLLVGLIRVSGSLQFQELLALDFLFARQPDKVSEPKVVIVKISENDLQQLQEYPLSDRTLTQVLTKIKQQQPSVIGLNIFRNFIVPSASVDREQNLQAYQELLNIFQNTNNLFGIEKITQDVIYGEVKPPAILKQLQRTTSADIIADPDGVVRRGILFPVTDGSSSANIPSMGLAVALNYLAEKEINPTKDRDGWLQLQDKVFLPFKSNDGGYVGADNRGYQILINWRGNKDYFPQVSISDVLNNNLEPDLFRDRIVLIGTTAVSVNDVFYVPHLHDRDHRTTPMGLYGVEIQAHLASYIIDAVLENRPLIKVLPEVGEYIWLTANIFIVAFWGWNQRKCSQPLQLFLIISSGTLVYIFLVLGISYLVFFQGWWLPIVPTLIGIIATSVIIKTCIYIDKLQTANLNLENQVLERTQELSIKNRLLKSTIQQLEQTQSQLIAKEKLANLGRISAGIAHEIRNPLNLINLNAQILNQYYQELIKKIEDNKCFFEELIVELFNDGDDLVWLTDKIDIIQKQVQRGEKTIQDILSYTPSVNLNFTLVNLREFIRETINLVRQQPNFDHLSIESFLEINIIQENLEIELIVNDFRRVLINILENAYDSLIEKKNIVPNFKPEIKITLEEDNSVVKIIIRDNGRGIAKEEIKNIFLPFYTQKQSGKGTGLGLFFAREIIVSEHQGTIDVDTQLHEYCQFTISLPKNREVRANNNN